MTIGSSTSDISVSSTGTTPELPFDVIDHIFSSLRAHPEDLLACSKAHPILSQIVERYRFHHIIIHTGSTDFTYSFRPSDLLRYLAETPRIVNYVAVLQVEFRYQKRFHHGRDQMTPYLEEIASLLPMFPLLECIVLPTRSKDSVLWWWQLPQSFRTAVETCLQSPALQEIHFGEMSFPLSMLDNHANINHLSLAGPPEVEGRYLETTRPQIKTLALGGFNHHKSKAFCTWAKRHILKLQTLKYDLSCHEIYLEVIKICSVTLKNLYIYLHCEGTPQEVTSIDLSSLPHLRHLTIHVEIFFHSTNVERITCTHFFPEAVKILKSAPSLEQLTIEIYVDPFMAKLDRINLSPLTVLTESSVCFQHIDLYMYTGSPRLPFTHANMGSLLAKHESLMKLVEQGVLVIHPEETAPTLFRSYPKKKKKHVLLCRHYRDKAMPR